jgi:hypothetical protein
VTDNASRTMRDGGDGECDGGGDGVYSNRSAGVSAAIHPSVGRMPCLRAFCRASRNSRRLNCSHSLFVDESAGFI